VLYWNITCPVVCGPAVVYGDGEMSTEYVRKYRENEYLKEYREKNPDYVQRNVEQQRKRRETERYNKPVRICPDCEARELEHRKRYCSECAEVRKYFNSVVANMKWKGKRAKTTHGHHTGIFSENAPPDAKTDKTPYKANGDA
jgi:hypothetical protein